MSNSDNSDQERLDEMILKVWGLGDTYAHRLKASGISDLDQLSKIRVQDLLSNIKKLNHPSRQTWPLQAFLAVNMHDALLEGLTARLASSNNKNWLYFLVLDGLPRSIAEELYDSGFSTYAELVGEKKNEVLELLSRTEEPVDIEYILSQVNFVADNDWEGLINVWSGGSSGHNGDDGDGNNGDDDPPDESNNNQNGEEQMPVQPIVFVDLDQRNREVYERLRGRWQVLYNKSFIGHEGRAFEPSILDPQLRNEFKQLTYLFAEIADVSAPDNDFRTILDALVEEHGGPLSHDKIEALEVIDPLFFAVSRALLSWDQDNGRDRRVTVSDHKDGKFPSQQGDEPSSELTGAEREFAAIYGIMLRENAGRLLREDIFAINRARENGNIHASDLRRLNDILARAKSEHHTNNSLYNRVISVLVEEGGDNGYRGVALFSASMSPTAVRGAIPRGRLVRAEQVATVGKTLSDQGVSPDALHFELLVQRVLTKEAKSDDGTPTSIFDIDLPDLEVQADVEIIADNLRAMQAIYFAATLEDMKVFQVMDKVIELYEYGYMPFGRGSDGDLIYQYRIKKVNRLSEYERLNLYNRTLGIAGGDVNLSPNREFQSLWMRFISAVSSFSRQITVDSLLRSTVPGRVHQEQVRKAGRDLAANLSLYGYGMTYHAAVELQQTIQEVLDILKGPEVKAAFGARDVYQVIEQVATLELGVQVNTVRTRTMATAGATIIAWLEKKANELASIGMSPIIDNNEILNPSLHPPGSKPTNNPFDSDLVNACERWLAVTGTPDQQVEDYANPFEGPVTPSRPIQLPSTARDILQSAGIGGDGLSLPDIGV